MPADDLRTLLLALEAQGVEVWLDGGWGVDALIGEETRPHADVDIVLREEDVATAVWFLRQHGYRDVPRDDTRPCNFVLGDDAGREVDFHVVRFDGDGNGVYGSPPEGTYPAWCFAGTGTVGGHPVRCVTIEYQLANRSGYTLRDKDRHDIEGLCHRFGLALPDRFRG